ADRRIAVNHRVVDLRGRVLPLEPLLTLLEQLEDAFLVDHEAGLLQGGPHERGLLNQTLGGRLPILWQILVELAKSRDLSLDALNLFFLGVKSHRKSPSDTPPHVKTRSGVFE